MPQDNSITVYKGDRSITIKNDPETIKAAQAKGWSPNAPSKGDAPSSQQRAQGEQPGALQRFAQSWGIPTSQQEAQQFMQKMQPQGAEKFLPYLHGGRVLWDMGKSLAKSKMEGLKGGMDEFSQGLDNIVHGQPIMQNLGKAGSGIMDMMLKGNIGGDTLRTAGQDKFEGNIPGMLGSVGGLTSQVFGPELLGKGADAALERMSGSYRMSKEASALESTAKLGREEGPKANMAAAKVKTQELRTIMNDHVTKLDQYMAAQRVNTNTAALRRYTARARNLMDEITRSPQVPTTKVSAIKDITNRLETALNRGTPLTWPEARQLLAEYKNALGGLKGASELRTTTNNIIQNLQAAVDQGADSAGVGGAWDAWQTNYHRLSAMERAHANITASQTPAQLEASATTKPPIARVRGVNIGGTSRKVGRIAKGELKGWNKGINALERNIKGIDIPNPQSPWAPPVQGSQTPGLPPAGGGTQAQGPFQQPASGAPPSGGPLSGLHDFPQLGPQSHQQVGPSTLMPGQAEKGVVQGLQQWERTNPQGAGEPAPRAAKPSSQDPVVAKQHQQAYKAAREAWRQMNPNREPTLKELSDIMRHADALQKQMERQLRQSETDLRKGGS